MRRSVSLSLIGLLLVPVSVWAQAKREPAPFTRLNSVGVFGEYSNDSSHILLGSAESRKLLTFGLGYERRFLLRKEVALQYMAELRPVLLESDPVVHETQTITSSAGPLPGGVFKSDVRLNGRCRAGLISAYSGKDQQGVTYTTTTTGTCGREWTFGEGMSPAGLKVNLLPRHRVQPVFTLLGGYMFSTQPIPVDSAGSFNFTFEVGAGLEFYRSESRSESFFGNRSLRAEYRYQHISDKNTSRANPGIDSGLLQVTYAFGR